MSTHNICFHGKTGKIPNKKVPYLELCRAVIGSFLETDIPLAPFSFSPAAGDIL